MLSSLPASIRANVIAPTALQPHVFNAVALALHKQWRQDKSLDWLMKPDGHLVKSLQYMQAFAQSQAQRRVVRRRQVERNVALDSSVFRVLEFGYMMDDVAVLLEDTLTALELWQRYERTRCMQPLLAGASAATRCCTPLLFRQLRALWRAAADHCAACIFPAGNAKACVLGRPSSDPKRKWRWPG